MTRSVFNHRRSAQLLISADSFNRADNATSLGSTDGAGTRDPATWTQQGGAKIGIATNRAQFATSGATRALVTADLATPDVDIRVDRPNFANLFDGIVFRFNQFNPGQYWVFVVSSGNYFLGKVNGTSTGITITARAAVINDSLRVVANGNQIDVFVNDTHLGGTSDSYLNNMTKHGMTCATGGTATNAKWDDWKVWVP